MSKLGSFNAHEDGTTDALPPIVAWSSSVAESVDTFTAAVGQVVDAEAATIEQLAQVRADVLASFDAPAIVELGPADVPAVAVCHHANGYEHEVATGLDGLSLYCSLDDDDETPPTVELVRDYLDDALALVSQLVDEQLPAVRRGLSDVRELEAFDVASSGIALAWAQLTVARRWVVELRAVAASGRG